MSTSSEACSTTRAMMSLNLESMRCSFHSCMTLRRVYLNEGTHRTLRMSSR